jgi:hypothetical protein
MQNRIANFVCFVVMPLELGGVVKITLSQVVDKKSVFVAFRRMSLQVNGSSVHYIETGSIVQANGHNMLLLGFLVNGALGIHVSQYRIAVVC